VEHITVCLDVGAALSPRIGFECILQDQPPREPRWASFLDELVRQGLCVEAKRDGLLKWPGRITPPMTSTPWPAHLICAAVQQPEDVFTGIDRRVSHVKLTYSPRHQPEAKAYFGFQHSWLHPHSAPDRASEIEAQMRSAGIEELRAE
ncbi:hypothetical protein NQ801_18605, partial [Acinetobacter baumannii]|nr:hypothetical protein [Acinetobacter baumannii]